MAANMALWSGTSMRWPMPVRWRALRAMATDTAAMIAPEAAGGGQGQEQRLVHAGDALVGAGGRADDMLPAAVVAAGAVLAEAGQGAVDESGVGLRGFVADAEAVGDAGTEVLDEDVGPSDEVAGLLLAVLRT